MHSAADAGLKKRSAAVPVQGQV